MTQIIYSPTFLFLAAVIMFPLAVSNKMAFACEVPPSFRIFDATLYLDKPNLFTYGITSLPSIDSFWRPNPPGDEVPSLTMVRKAIRQARIEEQKEAFINVEHWPLRGDISTVYENIIKYKHVVKAVKSESPETLVGLYGMVPIRDYWRAVKPNESGEHRAWRAENDNLSMIVLEVDFLLPSLYTFYNDTKGWEKYAVENLLEARRIAQGKPVYAFLWPQYHDSNRLLGGRYLPRQFWRMQLETVYKYADGVVFWGGWNNGRMKWDESMEWWQETLKWLKCGSESKYRIGGYKPNPMETPTPKYDSPPASDFPIVSGPYFDSGAKYYHIKCPNGVSDSLFNDGSAWRFRGRKFLIDLTLNKVTGRVCRPEAGLDIGK